MSRRGLIGAAGAAGVARLVGRDDRDGGQDARRPSRSFERVVWAVDGVADLEPVEIDLHHDSDRNVPSVTPSGRLRVTSGEDGTDNSHRQAWLIPGTGGFVDGEARTVWWPPSVMSNTVAPQMGLVLRLTGRGGMVVDQNIMLNAFTSTIVAPWSWAAGGRSAKSRRGTTNRAISSPTDRAPYIEAVVRSAGRPSRHVYLVDRIYEFASGDSIEVTSCADATFNGRFVVDDVVPVASGMFPRPAIICADPGQHAPVDVTPMIGRISRSSPANGIEPASIYPFHVAMRMVGSVVSVKRWRVGDVEPTWDDPTWALTIDTKGDRVRPPARGGIGLMTNHLHGGAWVEFGDVEIIRY